MLEFFYAIAHLIPLITNSWSGIALIWGCSLAVSLNSMSHNSAFPQTISSDTIIKPIVRILWGLATFLLTVGILYPFILPEAFQEYGDCVLVFNAFATIMLAYFTYVYYSIKYLFTTP